jgi:hypothetical protein
MGLTFVTCLCEQALLLTTFSSASSDGASTRRAWIQIVQPTHPTSRPPAGQPGGTAALPDLTSLNEAALFEVFNCAWKDLPITFSRNVYKGGVSTDQYC